MFNVEATDKIEKIGEGRHERFIINVPSFKAKFNKKQEALASINTVESKSIKEALEKLLCSTR